jgi:uncharacterized protein (TIGR02118 family)
MSGPLDRDNRTSPRNIYHGRYPKQAEHDQRSHSDDSPVSPMTGQLGSDPPTLIAVAIATVGICLTLFLLLRLSGARSLAITSGADVACMIALGAVVGRTTLLAAPTLSNGVLALVILFGIQRLLAGLGRRPWWNRVLSRPATVLIAHGQVSEEAVRPSRLSHDDLRQRLRLAGVTDRAEVRLAVLERTGEISVLRERDPENWLTTDLATSSQATQPELSGARTIFGENMHHLTVVYGVPTNHEAFDHHYRTVHVPLVDRLPHVTSVSIGKCEPFGGNDVNAYLIARLEFASREDLVQSLSGPAGQSAVADIANFATGGATVHVTGDGFLDQLPSY